MEESQVLEKYQGENDNHPIDSATWVKLRSLVTAQLSGKRLFVVDTFCGANPDSRLTLTDDRDALGLRRLNLDWKFTADDLDAIIKSMDLFARKNVSPHLLLIDPCHKDGLSIWHRSSA